MAVVAAPAAVVSLDVNPTVTLHCSGNLASATNFTQRGEIDCQLCSGAANRSCRDLDLGFFSDWNSSQVAPLASNWHIHTYDGSVSAQAI